MATKQWLLATIAMVAIILPAIVHSAQYMVGDDNGWSLNFNYTKWAQGKEFKVGDTLVFKYEAGYHNVYRATGDEFKSCMVPSSQPLTSGNDVITLSSPGRKWYICGVAEGGHCSAGQRLVINVQTAAPAPAPLSWWWPAPASSPPSAGWGEPAAWSPAIASSPFGGGGGEVLKAPAPSPSSGIWYRKLFFKN